MDPDLALAPDPTPDPIPDSTPIFSDIKDAKKNLIFFFVFSLSENF